MWHDLTNKNIGFPSKSATVLVANNNLDWWEPNKYSLISVDKLLDICDKSYCQWTHWMEIPEIPKKTEISDNDNCCLTCHFNDLCGQEKPKEFCETYIDNELYNKEQY